MPHPATSTVTAPVRAGADANSVDACNEVRLVGRVSGLPEERELPSGDRIVLWRVVIDRPTPRRPARAGVRVASVDTLDCVAWGAGVRRTARGLRPGDVVSVTGALRRRFFRAGAAATSRTEVEVDAVRRLARGAATRQASR